MIKLLERISGMLGEQKNSIGKKVYSSIGDDQLPTEVGALFASSKNAPYYVFPTSHGLRPRSLSAVIADGKFVFAIALSQPNEIRVGRGGDGVGHASLTGNKDVLYAGTVTFKNGKLLTWNNDTGHYHTQPEHASQAQIVPVDTMEHPLLPEEKFAKFKY